MHTLSGSKFEDFRAFGLCLIEFVTQFECSLLVYTLWKQLRCEPHVQYSVQ